MRQWTSTSLPCPRCGKRFGRCGGCEPVPRRRRLQWSLRTLLGLVIFLCVAVIAGPSTLEAASYYLGLSRPGCGGPRSASATLKSIATAQADFRSNDRDNDGIQNYWVRDVYGLFALCPRGGARTPENMIRLVEPALACADSTRPEPWGGEVDVAAAVGAYSPKDGYLFIAMTHDATGAPYDSGSGRNWGQYAFCAYPVSHSVENPTFIMNESFVIFRKNTRGAPVLRWPADLTAEGWTKLD